MYPANLIAPQPIPASQTTVARGTKSKYRSTSHLCLGFEHTYSSLGEAATLKKTSTFTSDARSGNAPTNNFALLILRARQRSAAPAAVRCLCSLDWVTELGVRLWGLVEL